MFSGLELAAAEPLCFQLNKMEFKGIRFAHYKANNNRNYIPIITFI